MLLKLQTIRHRNGYVAVTTSKKSRLVSASKNIVPCD